MHSVRIFTTVALAALLSGAVPCQTPTTSNPAVFEVADVHPSASTSTPFMRGGSMAGGRYELHDASMVDLIHTAYNVDAEAVFGGPSWLDSDRFEVLAK